MIVSIAHGCITFALTVVFAKYCQQHLVFLGALIGEILILPVVLILVYSYIKKDKMQNELNGDKNEGYIDGSD